MRCSLVGFPNRGSASRRAAYGRGTANCGLAACRGGYLQGWLPMAKPPTGAARLPARAITHVESLEPMVVRRSKKTRITRSCDWQELPTFLGLVRLVEFLEVTLRCRLDPDPH
ncbi:hypothetical protein GW17_00010459 [Ensete ventricosum]|nr:hypothetical protein GW17_00010459 [Ensete ventricosum]